MIYGKKVALREIHKDDLGPMMIWRNDPTLRVNFREFRPLTELNQERWFDKIVTGSPDHLSFSIVVYEKSKSGAVHEKLIGYAGLNYIDWRLKSGEFGIYIAPDNGGEYNFRGKGLGKEALLLLLKYGFQEVGLHKIWAEVYSFNDALHFYEKLGFVREGVLRDNCFDGGRYHDSILLSMLEDEYRQLHCSGGQDGQK